jgi:hypothetical protein
MSTRPSSLAIHELNIDDDTQDDDVDLFSNVQDMDFVLQALQSSSPSKCYVCQKTGHLVFSCPLLSEIKNNPVALRSVLKALQTSRTGDNTRSLAPRPSAPRRPFMRPSGPPTRSTTTPQRRPYSSTTRSVRQIIDGTDDAVEQVLDPTPAHTEDPDHATAEDAGSDFH